jgi:hypothetical protein
MRVTTRPIGGNAELGDLGLVPDERGAGWNRHRHFADDHDFLRPGEREPEPDANGGEHDRDQAAGDLERVLDHKKPVFRELERRDQKTTADPVDEDDLLHSQQHTGKARLIAGTANGCTLRLT